MDSLTKVQLVTRALMAKKALNVVVLDLQGLTVIADYFAIVTATSRPHARAMGDAIEEDLRNAGMKGFHIRDVGDASWVLIDLGDVVVHIFDAEHREFYKLERLWADAPRLPLPEDT